MAYRKKSPCQDARGRTYPKMSHTQGRSRPVLKWEREFCLQVGGIQWKDFLKTKKYILPEGKIMLWDDSEGEECFYSAKCRFWALKFGYTRYYNIHHQNPDRYIDKIDWNSEVDPQLLMELEAALEPVPYDHREKNPVISVEEIEPTGWDVCEDWQGPRCLTGLIVGDKEDGHCMGQQEPANCSTIN
ncbi:hypothetical protein DKX38_010714 [Salix brachista]|uniref:Uncharacterized protein n=1 Tax=Salix brachista TaxID=2182728 RepID=A0A5N5MGI8_9ROSI|nr:hypothetical protein DKX38_010714 [Salix brachista]